MRRYEKVTSLKPSDPAGLLGPPHETTTVTPATGPDCRESALEVKLDKTSQAVGSGHLLVLFVSACHFVSPYIEM